MGYLCLKQNDEWIVCTSGGVRLIDPNLTYITVAGYEASTPTQQEAFDTLMSAYGWFYMTYDPTEPEPEESI